MNDPARRLPALDFLRGVAVLGILAINIAGMAGPAAATLSPHVPAPGGWADEAWFALTLVLFEGKMRALFSLLFGASLMLFIARAEAAGKDGEMLQMRRLGWLLLFGYLHYLIWWGDILFTYALAGLAALTLRGAPPRALATGALVLFAGWHMTLLADGLPRIATEARVLEHRAAAPQAAAYHAARAEEAAETAREMAEARGGFIAQARTKLTEQASEPLEAALATMGETLPLMMLGMALHGMGFFAGTWPRRRMAWLAAGGIGLGGALTLGFAALAWQRHFPPVLMVQGMAYALALPHLLMALGYAAALIPLAPRAARTPPGRRLIAAGRMAFSNYLGMTLVMTFAFYGWGLGLYGQVPPRWQSLFVLGGWALMLGWSAPWLARMRQGPLEWAWRSLTEWRLLPLVRYPDRS